MADKLSNRFRKLTELEEIPVAVVVLEEGMSVA